MSIRIVRGWSGSLTVVAEALFATTSGLPVTQVEDSIYLVDVVRPATKAEHARARQHASLAAGPPLAPTTRCRCQASRPLTIRWPGQGHPATRSFHDHNRPADTAEGVMAAGVVEDAAAKVDELRAANPNYHIEVGGTVEGAEEGLASVVAMLPVMAVIILIVLMFPVAERATAAAGPWRHAVGLDRCRPGHADHQHARRLHRRSRHDRADRHDHPQLGGAHRPDRSEDGGGQVVGKAAR